MSIEYADEAPAETEGGGADEFPYRILSKGAVVSLLLASLATFGFLSPVLLSLAVVGLSAGWVALGRIRRYPQEFSGQRLAHLGMLLNSVVLVSGAAMHSYIYATEVPEGHTRISFSDLQPDATSRFPYPPPNAFDLNGKEVFIKGYMYPDSQKGNITRFILIPDLGTCCFGGQPKLTDMVEVTLRDPLRLNFAYSKRALAGKLTVDGQLKPVNGLGGVYYQLDASYAK